MEAVVGVRDKPSESPSVFTPWLSSRCFGISPRFCAHVRRGCVCWCCHWPPSSSCLYGLSLLRIYPISCSTRTDRSTRPQTAPASASSRRRDSCLRVFKVLRSVLDNIHIVTLADNELKAISSKFFSAFSQLEELDLQGNVLTKLPDAVGEMEHLTCINLANNSFSIFPDKLTEIATLERINLEGNSITVLPVEKLADMPALKWINVKSNPLDSNTQSALQSLHNLEILSTTES